MAPSGWGAPPRPSCSGWLIEHARDQAFSMGHGADASARTAQQRYIVLGA